MVLRRVFLAGSLAALLFLAGCPSQPGPAAGLPPQATAPSLPAQPASQAGSSSSPAAQLAQPNPTTESPQATAERDRELIASVEQAYHDGLTNYQQGHAEAARANFDYAVDLMLRCHCDLRENQSLSDEFDRIVDAVNTLELDAMHQGTNAAQQAEPSPVDVAGNITTTAGPNVVAKAEQELKTTTSDLPLVMNQYVANYIDFFTNNPRGHATVVDSLERMGRYKSMIQAVLKQEGVPQDLIYQAFGESGFRPQAVNPRSGAGGMWQFMPFGTYGLERNAWVDQRFDPVESTRAYAREIKKDYQQLGDWYLAMAAYDWGAGNVQRAVERTGYADFWQLYERNNLPQETKNYVPVFLAVAIMAKNPRQYGLDDLDPDPPLLTDNVTTNYAVDLRLVSDIVGAPLQEIQALNPSLLRNSTPPDDPYVLHLPAGTAPLFTREIAEIPVDKRRYWRLQAVKPGETLESVAHTWHVSLSELAFVNQLSSTSDLSGVDSLVIPLAPQLETGGLRNELYRVRRGDTLVTIADRFGITMDQLRRWNRLRGSAVEPGRRLYVAEPAHIYAYHRRSRGRSTREGEHRTGTARRTSTHTAANAAGKTKRKKTTASR